MCGIAGFVTVEPFAGAESVLRRMMDSIRHRGPDDSGFFHDSAAHLGHRRLSIIDVAGGHQPMSNEDGSRWIVYNGEVFNHALLRPELEGAGHRYATRCDTETILHAYEQYGADCARRLRGMWAFAIWDQSAQKLFCSRDRLGKKPLYYYWDGRTFVFGSEIKAVLEHPAVSIALEEASLPEYLGFGYLSGERTLFRGVRKLMPGHNLVLDLRQPTPEPAIECYWDVPPPAVVSERRSDSEWIAETRRRVEETVEMRLMSDVPLGMFLSGGLDSSMIAAIMKRIVNGPVKTFSVGYAEEQFSELSFASQVSAAIGTEHYEVSVGMDDFFNALPRMIWHEDEPIAWPSSVSLYFVSKLAAEQVKVVLTGEGSDELFGGYERYRWNLINTRAAGLYGWMPHGLRSFIRSRLGTTRLLNARLRNKILHTFAGRENNIESLFLDNFYCAFPAQEQETLLSLPPSGMYDSYLQYWNARRGDSLLQRMLYADQKTYLIELLMKQDQMSMACSIESRVPLLDHELVEFAAGMPDHMKIRGGTQKYVLKKAAEGLLPADIIYRKKMGFPTPLRAWLHHPRSNAIYSALQRKDGLLAEYIDRGELDTLIDRHRRHHVEATDKVWRLLNLQLWGDVFLAANRNPSPAGLPLLLEGEAVHSAS
ncbi:MAG TPA: asparagine synthase (glutamine-hydrolyzing) [Bryobacteraceae bacterium]|nr:asparagine synthase (glutamine-hydrolyzing) [Bryobacteraceae bacterium]